MKGRKFCISSDKKEGITFFRNEWTINQERENDSVSNIKINNCHKIKGHEQKRC